MDDEASSNLIVLSKFLAQWEEATAEYDRSRDTVVDFHEFALNEMQISSEMMTELDSECSPSTLSSETDPKSAEVLLREIPDNTGLCALEVQREELEHRKEDTVYKNKVLDKMKYRGRDGPWKHHVYNRDEPAGRPLAKFPDLIITVQIYRPYSRKKMLILDQEFEVLGQQLLTELRSKIYCISDYVAIGNFSENPDHPCDVLAKDIYKSGFFFIEGTFYNDLHDESCRDYSKPIMKWSKDKDTKVGPFQSQTMENVRFIDLTVRLGQPYLYMHQGDCEHLLIFSDIRVTHNDDCHFIDKYPVMTYKSRERKPKCRVCQQHLAKWVTYGSPLTPEDPCFFCDTCFRALHYDTEDRMIVSNVTLYPYPDSYKMAFSSSS